MPVVSATRMTASQFLQLGEDPPGVHLELVGGEVAVSPSPSPQHSHVDTRLRILVGNHVIEHDLGYLFGDVDTIFSGSDVRRPDIIYFSKARAHLIGDKAMEGPPDLCVEIISPGINTTDRIDKCEQYADGGVSYYWMVSPDVRSIEGYKLVCGKYVLVSKGKDAEIVSLPPFEGLNIPLASLWLTLPGRKK